MQPVWRKPLTALFLRKKCCERDESFRCSLCRQIGGGMESLMEMSSMFSEHWLELAAAVYLIGMILYGHYRGFIRLAVSVAALVITLFAVRIAQPYVTDWLKNETPVYESIVTGIEKAAGLDEAMENMPEDHVQEKAAERVVIEGLNLPEQLKGMLINNNNGEVYQTLGVNLFREYVSGYLADLILRFGVFAGMFMILFILLKILVVWLDLLAKLPILSGLNQIAGAILGGAEAMIFLWIICLILTVFSGTELGRAIMNQISASPWLSWIYDHNMLSVLAAGVLQTMV